MVRYEEGDLVFDLKMVLKIVSFVVGIVLAGWTLQSNVSGYMKEFQSEHREMLQHQRSTIPVLRQICRNTAKTEGAQHVCDQTE